MLYLMNFSHIVLSDEMLYFYGISSLVIPAFFFRKKGYINFVSKSIRRPSVRPSVRLSVRPSVRLSVRPCVRPSVTFLVNVSPPKPLEVATSNFVGE